jgi:CDP-glucose 4,6-dehydratase
VEGVGVSEWAGRRALVTGATGIVGSWLVKELLAQDAYVVAFVLDVEPQSEVVRSGDLQRCAVVTGSLEDLNSLERAVTLHDVDSVFHLGAQTIVGVARRAPLATLETNVRGTYNLLEVCRRHSDLIRSIVIASSDKAYGEAVQLPYTEESRLAANHPYDVSKAAADMIAQAYHHTYGLPLAIARCGNIFGGGDLNWSRIVPGTIRSLLAEERPVLRSDGTFVRDYLYVRDAVAGYLDLGARIDVDGVAGGGFNFSAEDPISVSDLVRSICGLMGQPATDPIVLGTAVGEIHDQHLSSAKARRLLGWKPAYDRETGLEATIGWYREFFGR